MIGQGFDVPRLPCGLVLTASLALSACSSPATENPGEVAEPIVNGVPSGPMDDAIVTLAFAPGGQVTDLCSATALASNVLLTARHCVSLVVASPVCATDGSPTKGGEIITDYAPQDLEVILGSDLSVPPVAHGAKIVAPDAQNLCNADIALVVLDQRLNVPLAPIRLDNPPRQGDEVSLVGWGISNDSTAYMRRRRDDVAIEDLAPFQLAPGLGFLSPDEILVGDLWHRPHYSRESSAIRQFSALPGLAYARASAELVASC